MLTADGYAAFRPPDNGSSEKKHLEIAGSSGFRNEEAAR
jgi:hypothetical protein